MVGAFESGGIGACLHHDAATTVPGMRELRERTGIALLR